MPLPTPRSEVNTGWGKFEEGDDEDDEEEDPEESNVFCAGCGLRGNLEPPNCLLASKGERTLPLGPLKGRRWNGGMTEDEPVLVLEDVSLVSSLSSSFSSVL